MAIDKSVGILSTTKVKDFFLDVKPNGSDLLN